MIKIFGLLSIVIGMPFHAMDLKTSSDKIKYFDLKNKKKSTETCLFTNEKKNCFLVYGFNDLTSSVISERFNESQQDIRKKDEIVSIIIRKSTISSLKKLNQYFPLIAQLTIQNSKIKALDIQQESGLRKVVIESNDISSKVEEECKELQHSATILISSNNTVLPLFSSEN